jgi:hypothetical protein
MSNYLDPIAQNHLFSKSRWIMSAPQMTTPLSSSHKQNSFVSSASCDQTKT